MKNKLYVAFVTFFFDRGHKKIFIYITSVQLETFSAISDVINYILNWFFHCTIGLSIILNFIVNDMGFHGVHAYVVPCICSALA